MALTKEQLLIPRVMCVGTEPGTSNFPGSELKTGEIVTLDLVYGDKMRFAWIKRGVFLYEESVAKYPNCFRLMPWWEGRKPEDMPEYVRIKNKVLRVIKYNLAFGEFLPEKSKYMKRLEYTQPATEQEYLEYQKEKEDK